MKSQGISFQTKSGHPEYIRKSKDTKKDIYIAFLDAKSAFDVFDHVSLIVSIPMPKQLYDGWDRPQRVSTPNKGSSRGGILSTNMYKVDLNQSLNRMSETGEGGTIGKIGCPAPTNEPSSLQTLVSRTEGYILQPEESVAMVIPGGKTSKDIMSSDVMRWTIILYGKEMSAVTETMHIGLRHSSLYEEITINENIKKSRRSFYSLMSADLQGLDPVKSIQLYHTYVTPVQVYGLEVVLSKQKSLDITHLKEFIRCF